MELQAASLKQRWGEHYRGLLNSLLSNSRDFSPFSDFRLVFSTSWGWLKWHLLKTFIRFHTTSKPQRLHNVFSHVLLLNTCKQSWMCKWILLQNENSLSTLDKVNSFEWHIELHWSQQCVLYTIYSLYIIVVRISDIYPHSLLLLVLYLPNVNCSLCCHLWM